MATYTIVSIADFAFLNSSITSVNAPNLTEVTFEYPLSITSIAADAFGTLGVNASPLTTVNYLNTTSSEDLPPVLQNYTYPTGPEINDISGCFHEGTLILCFVAGEEKYVPVEQLRKGDLVKTYLHGYKKIDMIKSNKMKHDPNNMLSSMYCMRKTETNGLIADLIVSGGHSVLQDALVPPTIYNKHGDVFPTTMIDDKYLLLCGASPDFVQLTNKYMYTIYNFTMDSDAESDPESVRYGVWANGLLMETPSKEYLRQFS